MYNFKEQKLVDQLFTLKQIAEDAELWEALDFLRSLLGDIPSIRDWKILYESRIGNTLSAFEARQEYIKRFPRTQESLWDKLK